MYFLRDILSFEIRSSSSSSSLVLVLSEQYIFRRNVSNQSIDKFKQKLRDIDWNNTKTLQNINDAYIKFLEIFLKKLN